MLCACLLIPAVVPNIRAGDEPEAADKESRQAPAGENALSTDDLRQLKRLLPANQGTRVVEFFREHNPYLLLEFLRSCRRYPKRVRESRKALHNRYSASIELRKTDPDRFARTLSVNRKQSRCRLLGRDVAELRARLKDVDGLTPMHKELSDKLRSMQTLVAETVREEQRNQIIEINQLQAELREMRRLVQTREEKLDSIIQSRIDSLTEPAEDVAVAP